MKAFEMPSYIHINTNRLLSITNCFSFRSPIEMKRQHERCYQNGGMKGGKFGHFCRQIGWPGDVLHFPFL